MKQRYITIFLLLFLFNNQVFSQENSTYFLKILNSKEYTKEKKETILDSLFFDLSYSNFHDVHEYSRWIRKNISIKKAISINKRVINNKELQVPKNDNIRKRLLKNLGYFNYLIKEYYESLYYYHQATLIKGFDVESAKSYKKIGEIFFIFGDYYNAEKYYDKALFYAKTTNLNLYIGICIEAGDNLKKIKEEKKFNKGVSILKTAINIIEKHKNITPNKRILGTYNSLGDLYNEFLYINKTSNFKLSEDNYKVSLKIAKKIKDSSAIANIFNSLGYLHLMSNKDNSINYFKKSLAFSKDGLNPSIVYSNISNYYFQKEQFNLSLYNNNKAISLLVDNKQNKTTLKLDREALKYNNYKFYILNKLISKGITLNKLNRYTEALETFKNCDFLLDLVRHETKSNNSKLFWQEKATLLFNEATKACYFLNDTSEALYFTEKNKAILLLENVSEQKYNPKDEIDFEAFKGLKMSNYKLEDFSNKSKIITLKEIQKNLSPNTMLLDYIINDNFGYLISITKEETKLHEICDLDNLKLDIKSYLQLISKPITNKKNLETLKTLSKNISKTIIPFNLDTKQITKLLIIPDYNLQNIPFETLYNNSKLIVETFETSYVYSYSYLVKNNTLTRNPKKKFISFAPYSFDYDNLEPLNQSLYESKTITKSLNGDNFEKELATTENFKKNIYDYRIINISSHANANDSIAPWIAFKDRKLYLDEIYQFRNQAELVVLSACKTSLGDIKKGEGVFSLARGFFRSGSKSVIASLWNVNDKSNSEITISFYNYLKKGKTKSNALRQAKLDYLTTHSLSELSPYYWSSLVLIGDNASITLPNYKKFYFLLIIPFFLFFLFLKKKYFIR